MKLLVFSVFDAAVKAYMPPFYARAKGEAIRMFTTTVNDAESHLSKYPADYRLAFLGHFDDQTGVIEAVPPDLFLGAMEVKDDGVFPANIKTPSERRPM